MKQTCSFLEVNSRYLECKNWTLLLPLWFPLWEAKGDPSHRANAGGPAHKPNSVSLSGNMHTIEWYLVKRCSKQYVTDTSLEFFVCHLKVSIRKWNNYHYAVGRKELLLSRERQPFVCLSVVDGQECRLIVFHSLYHDLSLGHPFIFLSIYLPTVAIKITVGILINITRSDE